MTPSQAAKIVAVLLATYPHIAVADETSAAYERGLIDLDYDLADAAGARATATHLYGNRLPSIAEIREAALSLVAGEVRSGLEAWGDVLRLMRLGFSTWKAPTAADVGDPIVLACIQDIGWRTLCVADEDDSSPRARFIDGYDRLAAKARRHVITHSLPAVRRVLEMRAGEEEQIEVGQRRAAGALPLRRAVLELASHPAAAGDPAAQAAIGAGQDELRRRGEPVGGAAPVKRLLVDALSRGVAR